MTDHVKLAQESLDAVHDWQEQEGETDATLLATAIEAQAHATLALAEEQRTANLITFFKNAGAPVTVTGAEAQAAITADIRARLGLTPTAPGSES